MSRRLSACCVISVLFLCACEDTGVRPTTTVQATDSADQVLEGFSHYVTNEGILRSRVEADTAFFYEATQITELHKVKVVFYDVKGAESSTLTARRGTYRWQDGSMEATGNVVVVSPDGRRLATEVLRYENATNLIVTDRHFTFDRGTEHLEGNSFRSDPDFRNVVTDRPRGVSGDGMLLPGQ
jgi:LPS export ABC transporter protein LptC